jgi:hypothetical protein
MYICDKVIMKESQDQTGLAPTGFFLKNLPKLQHSACITKSVWRLVGLYHGVVPHGE